MHCTYLIRASCIPKLAYSDGTPRHEYVIFSDTARKAGIPQYFDNRQVYGYLTLTEEAVKATKLIGPELATRLEPIETTRKPHVFACFGLHSSGSTWMFNLAREIAASEGVDFVSLHRDSEENLPWDVFGSRLIIAKTHNPFPSFQTFIASSGEPAVITVRDPRDAAVSFMQRFPNSLDVSFEAALKALTLSADTLLSMAKQRKLSVFRYEDGYIGAEATADHIASLLGLSLTPQRRRAILDSLAPEAVKAKIRELEAAKAIEGEKVWDRQNSLARRACWRWSDREIRGSTDGSADPRGRGADARVLPVVRLSCRDGAARARRGSGSRRMRPVAARPNVRLR